MNTSGKLSSETISAEVIRFDQTYFSTPWNSEQWGSLNMQSNKLFGWREDDCLIGLALFQLLPGDCAAHLFKILVLPERRGDGTAQLFWTALLKEIKNLKFSSIYLEVEESNQRAIRFYSKEGFQILRKVSGYYSNGENALMMSLSLSL